MHRCDWRDVGKVAVALLVRPAYSIWRLNPANRRIYYRGSTGEGAVSTGNCCSASRRSWRRNNIASGACIRPEREVCGGYTQQINFDTGHFGKACRLRDGGCGASGGGAQPVYVSQGTALLVGVVELWAVGCAYAERHASLRGWLVCFFRQIPTRLSGHFRTPRDVTVGCACLHFAVCTGHPTVQPGRLSAGPVVRRG